MADGFLSFFRRGGFYSNLCQNSLVPHLVVHVGLNFCHLRLLYGETLFPPLLFFLPR